MIFEESCDTENCSNDAENKLCSTGINDILEYIQIENSYFNIYNIITLHLCI